MKIRYLINGVSKLSDEDIDVVAQHGNYYFIHKSQFVLLGVHKDNIPIRYYSNAFDYPLSLIEYLQKWNDVSPLDYPALDIEFHLPTLHSVN